VLEFLGQEMVKAALNAERSLTQTSGGVGSYNIGEIHQAASALTSQMIALQVLFYLNKFFMPGFSLYNRGEGGPPIWLKIQSIDQQERQLIMQLLGVAGNSEGGQEFFNMIDWRTIAGTSNIAILDEADIKRIKEERHQEAMANQEDQMQIASKFQSPAPAKLKPGEKLAPSDGAKKVSANAPPKKLEEAIALLANGQVGLPFILGEHEAQVLYEAGVLDEEIHRLFNPWHSRADGRFTSGPGGAGAAGGGETSTAQNVEEIASVARSSGKRGWGSFVKTTGKVLGLTGLGLVALAIITNDNGEFTPPPNLNPEEPLPEGETEQERQQRLIQERTAELERLTQNMPKFNSVEEAVAYSRDALTQIGVKGLPENVGIIVSDTPPENMEVPAGSIGAYHAASNSLWLQPSFSDEILAGNPNAMHLLAHEMGHGAQEDSLGIDLLNINELGGDNRENFLSYLEGQNDLVATMAISRTMGLPMTHDRISQMGEERNQLHQELNRLDGGNRPIFDQTAAGGYPEETKTWAGLAKANERVTGQSSRDFLLSSHDDGFSYSGQHALLVRLFPEQMENYSGTFGIGDNFPSQATIKGWIVNQYGINPDQALDEMLQEAAAK